MNMTRKDFLQTVAGAAAAAYVPLSASAAPTHKIKRGVSFYSYQEEFMAGVMNVEDCVRETADMGAEGIEILAEAMVPDYPNPPSRWIDQWNSWMEKYHTVPAAYCQFLETQLHAKPPRMTDEEAHENMVRDIDLAKRMGFKLMRPQIDPYVTPTLRAVERCLPYAEKNDMKMAIHTFHMAEPWAALIEKTGTKYMGFTGDMSMFTEKPLRVTRERKIRDGLMTAEMADYMEKAFFDGVPLETTLAAVRKMGYKEQDKGYGTYLTREVYGIAAYREEVKAMQKYMKYLMHFHGKFYEMDENCKETAINYDKGIAMLIQGGYSGYMVSEYEGQRFTQDAYSTDSCEQIRRHQVMLRRLLGEV